MIIDADSNKNIPIDNAAIGTIPSIYRPLEVIHTMALIIPGSSGGWTDVRIEKSYIDKNGKIAMNRYLNGTLAIKFFSADFIYCI